MTEQRFAGMAPLTAAGHARRQQIKAAVTTVLVRRRRQRRFAQAVLAVALAVLAVAVLRHRPGATPDRDAPPRTPAAVPHQPLPHQPPPPAPPQPSWQRITDDPTVLTRLLAPPVLLPPDVFVDDAALQDLLADAGRDPGIVRIAGRVEVAAELDDWHVALQP